MSKLPVVAAIPNYNMGRQLVPLLEELSTQNYADIYVLDDASTDASRDVVESFNAGQGVHFVSNPENKGANAARNQIMRALGYEALIHFMDADIALDSDQVVEAAQSVVPDEPFGFVGGLAKAPTGVQSVWNYGPHQDIKADVGGVLQMAIEPLLSSNPEKAWAIRRRFSTLLKDWPFPLEEPQRKRVFWNIEQNLIVRSDILKIMGGFDENIREHDIQDFAIRLHKKGLSNWFDPAISVRHKDEQNVRDYNRLLVMQKAELYIARKHGLRNWLFPSDKFDIV